MDYRVSTEPGAYLVSGPEGTFRVSKDKTCSCDHTGAYCEHVLVVARYLRAGGVKAPDGPDDDPPTPTAPAAGITPAAHKEAHPTHAVGARALKVTRPGPGTEAHRLWFTPNACPICGRPVNPERRLSTPARGPGWVCTGGGHAHFYQVRYGHLKAQLTDLVLPDEPAVTSIGDRCHEVQMPDGIHIVGVDDDAAPEGAFCYTCNAGDCAAITWLRSRAPQAIALPLPAEEPLHAAA